jgi:hypothetical protein
MAESFPQATHLTERVWKASWYADGTNPTFLGWCDEINPNIKIVTRDIRVGSLNKVLVGKRVVGLEGVIQLQMREIHPDLVLKLMPWTDSSKRELSPAKVVDLYTYAQKLLLHPADLAESGQGVDLTHDLTLVKTVPCTPYRIARDGEKPDVWAVDFEIFPDRTKLPDFYYGYMGAAPT